MTEKGNIDRQIEVVDDRVAEILRRKTGAERVMMVCECNETMRTVIGSYLSGIHPDWDQEKILAEVARRMLGEPT